MTITYRAPGMTCDHCKTAVIGEVSAVDGVAAVDVDLDAKLVHVHGADVDRAAVVAAIDEAGYDAVAAVTA
jgi:copper chaperone CopZ